MSLRFTYLPARPHSCPGGSAKHAVPPLHRAPSAVRQAQADGRRMRARRYAGAWRRASESVTRLAPTITAWSCPRVRSTHGTRARALRALREAFVRTHPLVEVDTQGYVRDVADNLVPNVTRSLPNTGSRPRRFPKGSRGRDRRSGPSATRSFGASDARTSHVSNSLPGGL